MSDLHSLRGEIDSIDEQLLKLFEQRMDVSARVAEYKMQNNLPIFQPQREREKLSEIAGAVRPDLKDLSRVLYGFMFELSRTYQRRQSDDKSEVFGKITEAIESTPQLFPTEASVACQGVEGAYSQIATQRMFKNPDIQYFKTFEGVFSAIDAGFCRYGILPIENSTAGSVTKIYDLMLKYDFSVVRSLRLKVEHSLLARQGASVDGITEIFSHEQAINQCSDFIKSLGNVKVTEVENTAAAAAAVAMSNRTDVAALSSPICAELYGLTALKKEVQNVSNNRTRFMCISKKLEIYPGADKTGIMLVLPHRPGALYNILARFYTLGINLIKLESRPLPGRDFEFMFYLDLETSVYSPEFAELISGIGTLCEEFKYLGSYTEVM